MSYGKRFDRLRRSAGLTRYPSDRHPGRLALLVVTPVSVIVFYSGCAVSRETPVTLRAVPVAVSQTRPAIESTLEEPDPLEVSRQETAAQSPLARRPEQVSPQTSVDLNRSAVARLGNRFQPLGSSGLSWELSTPAGDVLQITAGSRVARFNGLELWLGFAPALQGQDPDIHPLDLEKNVRPLLTLPEPMPPQRRRIVIDPGHGGPDPGTRSVARGRTEKEYTLDWALRLAPLLTEAGWNVVLTRTDDVGLTLAERVAVADAVQADFFLSLHFNSAPLEDRAGIETYCLTPAGLPSTLTRDDNEDPALAFPNNRYDEQNIVYAARLHAALVRATGGEDRGLRRARFLGILKPQRRPAVLLEGGFLSNLEEAARIDDPDFRQRLADALALALAPPSTPANQNPSSGVLEPRQVH